MMKTPRSPSKCPGLTANTGSSRYPLPSLSPSALTMSSKSSCGLWGRELQSLADSKALSGCKNRVFLHHSENPRSPRGHLRTCFSQKLSRRSYFGHHFSLLQCLDLRRPFFLAFGFGFFLKRRRIFLLLNLVRNIWNRVNSLFLWGVILINDGGGQI